MACDLLQQRLASASITTTTTDTDDDTWVHVPWGEQQLQTQTLHRHHHIDDVLQTDDTTLTSLSPPIQPPTVPSIHVRRSQLPPLRDEKPPLVAPPTLLLHSTHTLSIPRSRPIARNHSRSDREQDQTRRLLRSSGLRYTRPSYEAAGRTPKYIADTVGGNGTPVESPRSMSDNN